MIRILKYKCGNTVLTLPLVIVISFMIIIAFGIFTVNMILPFVWYQKLEHVSYKYTYVIEKFGYLSKKEKTNLVDELVEKGFDRDELVVNSPSEPKGYGNIIEFSIKYNYKQKLPSWKGSFKMITKNIPINVQKIIISKV